MTDRKFKLLCNLFENITWITMLAAVIFVSGPWNSSIEADKWKKWSTAHHCTPLLNDQYQCDTGIFRKPNP
jgi:hypothetical protein